MQLRRRMMGLTLTMLAALAAPGCGDDDGGDEEQAAVSTDDLVDACENGVALCMDDPTYGPTFGAQDCSPSAIESAYAGCDDGCLANAEPIIDCQIAAADCDGFAGCVP